MLSNLTEIYFPSNLNLIYSKSPYLPARSTRLTIEVFAISSPAAFFCFCTKLIPTMVWAREDVAFMLVAATVLFVVPSFILASMAL